MSWFSNAVEKITHRQELETKIKELESTNVQLFKKVEELTRKNNDDRVAVLENDRDELFRRNNDLIQQLLAVEKALESKLEVLENDRDELFKRTDMLESEHSKENIPALLDHIQILINNRDEIFGRIDKIENKLRNCGILNLNSRFDSRIIRLEMLWYYQNPNRRAALNEEQKKILEYLENDFDYGRNEGRTYQEDWLYESSRNPYIPYEFKEDNGAWYAELNGNRLYLGENKKDAQEYLAETIHWLEEDTPHRYLDPQFDGVDISEGSILVDVGAAEGYLGIKYLERCKKVYFFECDEKWLRYLRKTCEHLGDKVEIIEKYVGDREGEVKLDDFFRNREKPTYIKMDVEGAEGAVLRGMSELINSTDPLTLLICTYHRQEDENRYYSLLKDKFNITFSKGYYWDMQDPYPPFFRHGIMRAVKK